MVADRRSLAERAAREHPEAVALAQAFRAVFGDGVKLLYAKNLKTGAELGKPTLPLAPS